MGVTGRASCNVELNAMLLLVVRRDVRLESEVRARAEVRDRAANDRLEQTDRQLGSIQIGTKA